MDVYVNVIKIEAVTQLRARPAQEEAHARLSFLWSTESSPSQVVPCHPFHSDLVFLPFNVG